MKAHSCQHCQRLVIDLADSRRRLRDLGLERRGGQDRVLFDVTIGDICVADADGCSFCTWLLDAEGEVHGRPLRSTLEARGGHTGMEGSLLMADRSPLGRIFRLTYFWLWDPASKTVVADIKCDFEVYADPDDPASPSVLTRPIESSPASAAGFARLRSWLQECRANHDECRKIASLGLVSGAAQPTNAPARLIRIDSVRGDHVMRLVTTDSLEIVPEFVALSYCWGGDQRLKCSTSTLASFMTEIPLAQLPPTLRDAVLVCGEAGFDYLWVDALCIIQDDVTDQTIEIAKMPYVYGGAVFTIAASRCSSVEQPFLATRSFGLATPPAFTLPYRCEDGAMGGVTLVKMGPAPEPIDSRGWTFQERLLSPRTIEYGTWQTRWICQESNWRMDITDGWKRDADSSPLRQDTIQCLTFDDDDLRRMGPLELGRHFRSDWQYAVQCFTGRNLTMPRDRPLAISGIAARFASKVDVGDYVAGLWKPYMHSNLLWHIAPDRIVARPTAYQGPSWSWTAVNGPVTYLQIDWEIFTTPANIALDIISCHGELVDPHAPFGALRPNSARLKARGRLVPVREVRHASAEPDSPGARKLWQLGVDFPMLAGARHDDVFYDTTELDQDDAPAGDQMAGPATFLLQVVHGLCRDTWYCCGLVLRRVQSNGPGDDPAESPAFKRVGAFFFRETRMEETRIEGESETDWERRVDLQLDWFRDVAPTEIEIM